MVAVEDLAAAAVVVAMSGAAGHKVYCVADGEQYVTADLWDAIAAASGCGRRLWEIANTRRQPEDRER
ncbi:hypothetical protein, partial [Salmonella enterica]|uniref:hypothetical protein n=1 Tax=Salmonella enterica TaxID=28901 RepID=UPI0039EA72A2